MIDSRYKIALAQFKVEKDRKKNIEKALSFLDEAAKKNAKLLLLPELFEFPYFPISKTTSCRHLASTFEEHPFFELFAKKCKEKRIALIFSFFEKAYFSTSNLKAVEETLGSSPKSHLEQDFPKKQNGEIGQHGERGMKQNIRSRKNLSIGEKYYNSAIVIGANGKVVVPIDDVLRVDLSQKKKNLQTDGEHMPLSNMATDKGERFIYRKTHLPDGPGYEEKSHFSYGTKLASIYRLDDYINIGIGICWDQWFPEYARSLVVRGADVLLYPSAIGTEPKMLGYSSKNHWQTTICGHAAANTVPIGVSNRIGLEEKNNTKINFYGHSFFCDRTGRKVGELNGLEGLICMDVDVDEDRAFRQEWGLLRDRRTDLYSL